MCSLMFHTDLPSNDCSCEFIILVLPVDGGATAMKGFPKLLKTFIMGRKIVYAE